MNLAVLLIGCGWGAAPSPPAPECTSLTVAAAGITLATSEPYRLPMESWMVPGRPNAPAEAAILPLALALEDVPVDAQGHRCVTATVSPDTPMQLWSRLSATLRVAHVEEVDVTLADGSWTGRLALGNPIDPVSSGWPPDGAACNLVWVDQYAQGACVWALPSAQPGLFPLAAPNHFTDVGLQRCETDGRARSTTVQAVSDRCERTVVAASPGMRLSSVLEAASFASPTAWVLLSGASPRCTCGGG